MSTIEENSGAEKSLNFSKDQVLNIREIIGNYIFHWPVFVLAVVICLSVAYTYLRYTQPLYQISSTLLIKDQKKNNGAEILNQLDHTGGSQKDVESEVEILKSRTLMNQVVERLNLNVSYTSEGRLISTDAYETKPISLTPVKFNKAWLNTKLQLSFPGKNTYLLKDLVSGKHISGEMGILQQNLFGLYRIDRVNDTKINNAEHFIVTVSAVEDVVGGYMGGLTVEPKTFRSNVLDLGYTTTVVKKGEDILNTLVQVYNEASLKDKNRATDRTIQFINERIVPLNGELTDVEKSVENFKSSQGLTDITTQAEMYTDNVKENQLRLEEINLKLAEIDDIQRYVSSGSAQEKLPSTLSILDPVLNSQVAQLNTLQLQKVQLLSTTQEANPIMDPLNRQIETTQANIRASIKNIKQILLNSKAQLAGTGTTNQGSIKKIPGQERQFISIQRQQKIKEELYLYLLQKKEETALTYASAVADSRLIDPAIGSRGPIKPKKQIIYMVAFLVGLILPVVYIHAKDLLNNRIGSVADINKGTSAPLLSELVFHEGKEAVVVTEGNRSAIAEQFRALRTNLKYIRGKKTDDLGNVTLFTSNISGEGKSFVSTNLAAVLAVSGRKTVLLELDLRKPKITQYLNLPSKAGLSNYLIGQAKYEDILQESGVHPNLFVLGSGPIPPNPSELLIEGEIDVLIAYLKENFDEIIIDCPPIGLVTDAQILSRFADLTLYVLRHDFTLKSLLTQVDKLYRQQKFPKLNLILNGIKADGRNGYGYGYGYYGSDLKANSFSLKSALRKFFKRF
ncbi:polysaccharide biosynthesis tyrosine autokinase [Pedobacter sp. MC2016-14]|uniref:GumC family protein n=1 Tax=Pedobacter sp. MC2016-14 TaxID=2897327 RepID=UPI001E61CF63|nr:polysaccharide biosynthesis tyrosine autokinase [Pedobacter sp. MC2016-14]MCD0486911.1 polysaccharide biosynthesis tyrosine autokinase [Pedobacter sp. MC2016-14]